MANQATTTYKHDLKDITMGRVRALMKDGTICSAWIDIPFVPGEIAELSVHNGSTCSYTGYEDINLAIGICPDFWSGCGIVFGWIGWVGKLSQNHGTRDGIAELLGSLDGARHSVLAAGQSHFCTVSLHQVSALHTHGFRHGEDEVVALNG